MKRVLLLAFLIVSLVQLLLEREGIYLIFLTGALGGLALVSLARRRRAKNALRPAFTPGNAVGTSPCRAAILSNAVLTSKLNVSEDNYENP
jgi:hypothetical protein